MVKTSGLLNLIKQQRPDIDKGFLFVKDLFESKHQLLTNQREKVGIKISKPTKEFIDYSQTNIYDIYEKFKYCNPKKKRKVLIGLGNMIVDMEVNKKLSRIVTELFLRGRKIKFHLLIYPKFIQKCLKLYY